MALQAESQPLQHPKIQNIIFLDGSPAFVNSYTKKYQSTGVQREIDLLFAFLMMLGVEKISFEVSLPKNKNNSKMEETRNSHFLSECDDNKQASSLKKHNDSYC
ncbi:hypothetical protein TNCT_209261 [Trichonephila clavata]|uniref:Uncharacterized protein n=1 Tax=Trichonephila clavata TaxID=2740835 RepID=A0A8X6KEK3_TRICU|nr:hypothetical protein TNCT_209261 [Trichonephila clavata]